MENATEEICNSTVDNCPAENTPVYGSEHNPDAEMTIYSTEAHIWLYTAPILLILGIAGNLLTIMVMNRQRMRGTSTCVYLTMLAVGDMAVVVTGLVPEWLGQMDIVKIWNIHPWVCKLELYTYYTALDFAIWMLVAFTCDRVIAVRFPLQRRHLSTPRKAMMATGLIFMLANVNLHVFWTKGARYNNGTLVGNCKFFEEFDVFKSKILPYLVLAFALVGPFLIIAVSNIVILSTVKTAQQMRNRSVIWSMRNARTERTIRSRYGQTTLMCLITCVTFMILILPSIILLIGKTYWQHNPVYWHCRAVANQLVFLNHSINFLLYSLTGSRFRRELATIFTLRKDAYADDNMSSSSRSTRLSSRSTLSRNDRITQRLVTNQTMKRCNMTI